jgi:outer membrane protein, multidrug efflux system
MMMNVQVIQDGGFRRAWQVIGITATLALIGCGSAVKLPDEQQVKLDSQARAPAQWYATYSPMPHGGKTAELKDWWTQHGDALLGELIQAAQQESNTLAAAQARIAQARAATAQAERAMTPQAGIGFEGSRGVQAPKAPPATSMRLGLQASWELDIWGGKRAAFNAAELRTRGAELAWHEGRVIVAAEMASAYHGYRYCTNLLAVVQNDAASRSETARLAEITAKAGFSAPATAQLAAASSQDAASQLVATQTQCEAQFKAIVALTGIDEPVLRTKFKENKPPAQLESAPTAMFSIAKALPQLPAQLLAQRPDVAAAQDAVLAASLDARSASTAGYPALSLSGNVGVGATRSGGMASEGMVWSLGPVNLTIPLSQTAVRANTQASVAAYNQAVMQLRATARQAVREVETSLLELNAAQQRNEQASAAARGYGAALAATQARYRAGLASLVELEDARRTALFAQQSQLGVERDAVSAWISLYRATGGGWRADTAAPIENTPAKTTQK